MKGSIWAATFLVVLLLFPNAISARHIARPHSRHRRHLKFSVLIPKSTIKEGVMGKLPAHFYLEKRPINYKRIRGPDTLQVAGSSLPDCSHACGSCTPCRLVMVSFVCASVAEAETCPMAYKCMCNNKSYPVP